MAIAARITLLATLAFAAGALAAPTSRPGQPHPIPVEGNKTFVHAPSGFAFPFNITAFRRASVVGFDDAGKNVAVGYADPALKIIATIYVYPNHEMPAAEHFKQIKQDVQKVNPTAKIVEEKPMSIPSADHKGEKHEALYARFNMHGQLAGAEQDLFSEAYLFTHGQHFLKLRLTYPSADAKAAQTRIENFLSALAFPEAEAAKPKP